MDIPAAYLSQILAALTKQGILTATAGPHGGYTLAQPPAHITLLQVIEAAEGSTLLDQCVLRGGPCDWDRICPLHQLWSEAQAACTERLASTHLADIAHIDAAIQASTYQPPTRFPEHRTRTPRRGTR